MIKEKIQEVLGLGNRQSQGNKGKAKNGNVYQNAGDVIIGISEESLKGWFSELKAQIAKDDIARLVDIEKTIDDVLVNKIAKIIADVYKDHCQNKPYDEKLTITLADLKAKQDDIVGDISAVLKDTGEIKVKISKLQELIEKCQRSIDDTLEICQQKLKCNIHNSLTTEISKEHIGFDKILTLCRHLKLIDADNFLANLCELAIEGTPKELMAFVSEINFNSDSYLDDAAQLLIKVLKPEIVQPVSLFVEKIGYINLPMHEKWATQLSEKVEIFNEGTYDVTLHRDIFVAYHSPDIDKVAELVEYLEGKEKRVCFISYRNLKHGLGASHIYEQEIKKAIDNCTIFLFVSSRSSRTEGDARNLELDYVKDSDFNNTTPEIKARRAYDKINIECKKPRIEYLIEPYGSAKTELKVKDFFKGFSRAESCEAVARVVAEILDGVQFTYENIKENQTNNEEVKVAEEAKVEKNSDTPIEETKKEADEEATPKATEKTERPVSVEAEQKQKEAEKLAKLIQECRIKQDAYNTLFVSVTTDFNNNHSLLKYYLEQYQVIIGEINSYKKEKFKSAHLKIVEYINHKVYECKIFDVDEKLLKEIINEYEEISQNEKTVNFSVDNSHAKEIEDYISVIVKKTERINKFEQDLRTNKDKIISLGNKIIGNISKLKEYATDLEILLGESAADISNTVKKYNRVMNNDLIKKAKEKQDTYNQVYTILTNFSSTMISLSTSYKTYKELIKKIRNAATKLSISLPNEIEANKLNSEDENFIENILESYKKIPAREGKFSFRNYNTENLQSFIDEIDIPIKQVTDYYNNFNYDRVKEIIDKLKNYTINLNKISRNLLNMEKPWLAPDYPTIEHYDKQGIKIEDKILKAYNLNTEEVKIPYGVTTIDNYAFHGGNLGRWFIFGLPFEKVVIPDSVKFINRCAFYECDKLKTIYIPHSVTSIDKEAFAWCHISRSIVVDKENPNFADQDGMLFNKNKTKLIKAPSGHYIDADDEKIITSVIIPNGVTEIGDFAFQECINLENISLPDSVTSIGDFAFGGCAHLEHISIPDRVTSIGRFAFTDCKNLRSITIPDGVTSIGAHAFKECTNLLSLTIPDSIISIGDEAFNGCKQIHSVFIPQNVEFMGKGIFLRCQKVVVKCALKKRPEGWNKDWNVIRYGVFHKKRAKVIWGCGVVTGEVFDDEDG